ncbi:MAG: PQQ-binding-like beta-propeller repeat protein [Thermoanaerobaculia bacterium]|nr:PQQ-binding-like beta-propeller repeat protein [Thermoanaerobaculia bacterium]
MRTQLPSKYLLVVAAAALLTWATTASASTEERSTWPLFRGPEAGGPELGDVIPQGDFGFVLEWQRALGSGYSNISVADGKAVTMFTDGDIDVIAAFDAASGSELWRHELGEKYAGHDGSDDGPLGTPTLADGQIYALGPKGQLLSLSLADGSVSWSHTLDESNSTVPHYGYTAAPVVADDLVIVATGGEGRTLTAYSRKSGKQAWTVGDDSVTYQTPILLELAGKEQLVASTDRWLHGIDAATGKVLWRHQHTEGNQTEGSAHTTAVDEDTFLVKYARNSKLYNVKEDGVEEVWESRAFANTFALPVFYEDHFYGFTGNFLTCASLETGEIVWRSRPPGGLGLSMVDDHLAIVNPDGDLVLVKPSPSGYQEVTRIAALDDGDYAIPTYAAGRFYVRNLSQMAALRIDRGAAPQVADLEPDAERLIGAFGAWVKEVESRPEAQRQAAVDEKFGDTPGPQVNESGEVTFLYRGAESDVGIVGVGSPQGDGLFRLRGTDLFFRTYELDPKGQYGYGFAVDFGQAQADPGNPLGADMGFGPISELRMPGFDASAFIEDPADDQPRGRVDGFPFRSEALDNSREIQVYRPAGYGNDPEASYPLLIVNHGDNQLRAGSFQNSLDNLIGDKMEAVVAVFVPRSAGPEYGGPQADDYNRFLVEELIPHLEAHYRLDGRRAIMGPGSAGVQAVYAAYHHPDTFQSAAAQSFYEIDPGMSKLKQMIGESEAPGQIVMVYSKNDYDFPNGGQAEQTSKELIQLLRDADANVHELVTHYSPGWGGWRHQHDDVLSLLFPAPEKTEG